VVQYGSVKWGIRFGILEEVKISRLSEQVSGSEGRLRSVQIAMSSMCIFFVIFRPKMCYLVSEPFYNNGRVVP
jgi:hypothetical protein